MTALLLASQFGYINIIKLLLNEIIDIISMIDYRQNMNALHYASLNGHLHVIQEYLNIIKDNKTKIQLLSSKAKNGENVIEIAKNNGHPNIAKYLKKLM